MSRLVSLNFSWNFSMKTLSVDIRGGGDGGGEGDVREVRGVGGT